MTKRPPGVDEARRAAEEAAAAAALPVPLPASDPGMFRGVLG
jgi:hypothetical protein